MRITNVYIAPDWADWFGEVSAHACSCWYTPGQWRNGDAAWSVSPVTWLMLTDDHRHKRVLTVQLSLVFCHLVALPVSTHCFLCWRMGMLRTGYWWGFWVKHTNTGSHSPRTEGMYDLMLALRRYDGSSARNVINSLVKPIPATTKYF